MRGYRAAQALIVVSVLALAEAASAQDKKSIATAQADKVSDEGYKAYEAGKYADAIGLYTKAFQIGNDARLLYNIASIYDKKLHDRALAEDFYRRYLTSPTTEPSLVSKATDRLSELKKEADAEKAAAAPPPPPPAPAPKPVEKKPFPLRETGLIVGGVGFVFVIVGSAFGVSALSKASDVRDDCPNDVCRNASSVEKRDSASSAATASTVFWGLGLAAIGGGVAMVLLDPKTKQKGPFRDLFGQAQVRCLASGCGLAGTF